MKNRFSSHQPLALQLHKSSSLFIVFSMILALIPSQLVFAESHRLFITPPTSQMSTNTTFTVNVRSYADTDRTSGTASGTITYPTNLLQVTGTSVSGSAYSSPSVSLASGAINFSASRSPAPSGAAHIFSITFKSIGAGTATVAFAANSKVNNTTTTYASGVYTITNPSPPPQSTAPSSTPKPSVSKPAVTTIPNISTPTPTSQSPPPEAEASPTPDPTGVVDNVTISPLYSSVSIGWSVNAANPTSTFSYGSKASALDQSATVERKPDGNYVATIKNLKPGSRYYFSITGSGTDNKNGTYSGTFSSNGFPIVFTITENDQPANGAQVRVNNRNFTTKSNGKLSIGLPAGTYSGTITTDTATMTINLVVAEKPVPTDGSAPEQQTASYNLTSSPLAQGPGSTVSILSFIGVLIAGTVVIGFVFVGFMAHRRRKMEQDDPILSGGPSSTVIIDDGYKWKGPSSSDAPVITDYPPSLPTQPESQTPHHDNSVHIDEEEPLDMFEKDRLSGTNNYSSKPPGSTE